MGFLIRLREREIAYLTMRRRFTTSCVALVTTSNTLKIWFEPFFAISFFLNISGTLFNKILVDRARAALICINQQDL